MENNKKTKEQLLEQIKNLEKQNAELTCTIKSLKDQAKHMSERNDHLWHEKMLLTDWVHRILTNYNLRESDLEEMLTREKDRNDAFTFVIKNVDEVLEAIKCKPQTSDL